MKKKIACKNQAHVSRPMRLRPLYTMLVQTVAASDSPDSSSRLQAQPPEHFLRAVLASETAQDRPDRAAMSTIIFFSPYCADCDIVKQVKRSAAGRQVEAWVCSRWSSNQSSFSTALESTVREASESMLFSTSSKASVCRLASLAPLPVLSRVLLNEDWLDDHLEHTQASTSLPAAERFTCFTMSQSAQYGEKKMIVLIAARFRSVSACVLASRSARGAGNLA